MWNSSKNLKVSSIAGAIPSRPIDPHRFGRSLSVEDHPSWQRRFSVTSAVPTRDSLPRCDGSSSAYRTSNPSSDGSRPRTTRSRLPLLTTRFLISTYPRRSLRSPDHCIAPRQQWLGSPHQPLSCQNCKGRLFGVPSSFPRVLFPCLQRLVCPAPSWVKPRVHGVIPAR